MMRRAAIGVLWVAALGTTASAQDEPSRPAHAPPTRSESEAPRGAAAQGADAKSPPAKAEAFSLLGDPARFTRLGGWGGIGGSLGQFGMARSMLVMMPAVQEELELTDEQKADLRDWSEESRERGKTIQREMRAASERSMRDMDIAGAMQLLGGMSEIIADHEAGIARILDKKQRKRLDQLSLQMEGITAVLRPEVARALNITDVQMEKAQLILAQARFRQVGYWMQQGMAMRERTREAREGAEQVPRERGRNRAKPEPSAKKPEAQAEPDEASARRARRETMQKEFGTMRDGADRIQQQTVTALLKTLAPRQRATFERLMGPPFDPSKIGTGSPAGSRRDGEERRLEARDDRNLPDDPSPDGAEPEQFDEPM